MVPLRTVFLVIASFALASAVEAQSQYSSCVQSKTSDSRLDTIRTKVRFVPDGSQPSFSMLTNQASPTDEELGAIQLWVAITEECFDRDAKARYIELRLEEIAVVEATRNSWLALTARLYNREVTYGQYTGERQRLTEQHRAQFDELERRYDAKQQVRAAELQAQDDARRNAALQMLRNQRPIQLAPLVPYQMPVQPTVTTNCHRFGAQTVCTTR